MMKNEFTNIYEKELWGRGKGSGAGSRPKFNAPYISFLENFLRDNNIKSVIDFGCGDWQFSQYIDWGNVNYLGLDVVDSVIENNKKQFPEYSFISDTTVFPYLKDRELILIKDVIMHWPNEEIISFLVFVIIVLYFNELKALLILNKLLKLLFTIATLKLDFFVNVILAKNFSRIERAE